MTFWEAQDKAREIAGRGQDGTADSGAPLTVTQALDTYTADLEARGGSAINASRVRHHLPASLASKTVGQLTARELHHWRDALLTKIRPATVKRTCASLKAALTLAADRDSRITNRSAWRALTRIAGTSNSRNVVLSEMEIAAVVTAAREISDAFALLVEVCAVTGARISQICKLEIADLLAAPPRLAMPCSNKGRNRRRGEKRPVAIPPGLARRLGIASAGRDSAAPLLVRPDGQPWGRQDHTVPFRQAALAAGLDPRVVTINALRHSAITRMLLRGIPARIIAASVDTSIGQIEATYSKYIADHSDVLLRKAMLDLDGPATGSKIVPLRG
jgi:integrase